MAKRIDKKASKTARMFELFLKISQASRPVGVHELDEEHWGCEKTIGRMLREMNATWEMHHGRPLFKIVDEDGRPAARGARFLKVVDTTLASFRAERMAVFPAVIEFIKVLEGTIIADEFKPFYQDLQKSNALTRGEASTLKRIERKFVYHGKGMKNYTEKRDVLDEIYDALLKEHMLTVTVKKPEGTKTHVLCPLALVLYNNGLYLLSHFEGQAGDAEPYVWKVETFEDAKGDKSKPFEYPLPFDASKYLDGNFGLFKGKGDELIEVEFVFSNDERVKSYLRDRRFTSHDEQIEEADGRLILRMKVSSLTEVRSWVLSWGDAVTIIKPASLRQEVAEIARRTMALYSA